MTATQTFWLWHAWIMSVFALGAIIACGLPVWFRTRRVIQAGPVLSALIERLKRGPPPMVL